MEEDGREEGGGRRMVPVVTAVHGAGGVQRVAILTWQASM